MAVIDAAFYQKDLGEAYFFSVDKYCRVRWEPYTSIEKRTWGPALIRDHWKSLAKAGFNTVDAILPVPGSQDELYFFRGLEVVRIKFAPKSGGDTITEGPVKTLDKWKSLAGTSVDRVGAAIAVPGVTNQAYLFSGPNYVKLDVVTGKVIYGPTAIVKEWPGVAKAGFTAIHAALQVPEDKAKQPGETYFFYGDQYARIQVIASKPDVLQWGPKKWEDHWKTLDWIANQQNAQPDPAPQPTSPEDQGQADGTDGTGVGSSQGQADGTGGTGDGGSQGQSGAGSSQQPKPLISGYHMQNPQGIRVGKQWFNEYRNVPVTRVELWAGYWYANEYWGIRKMQITWEDGYRRVVGTDNNNQYHYSISLNPRGGERITRFYTQIGEIWDYVTLSTNRGQTLSAGGQGGHRFEWQLGNGVLLGFRGYTWPAEIVKLGPVFAR